MYLYIYMYTKFQNQRSEIIPEDIDVFTHCTDENDEQEDYFNLRNENKEEEYFNLNDENEEENYYNLRDENEEDHFILINEDYEDINVGTNEELPNGGSNENHDKTFREILTESIQTVINSNNTIIDPTNICNKQEI